MTSTTLEMLKGPKGALPNGLWTCLPELLQQACGYFDQPCDREAFLHGALPVLSRICENVVVPLKDDDHRLALQVFVYGGSASGKGKAGMAERMLKVIEQAEMDRYDIEMAKWKAEEPDEEGLKRPEPQRNDMTIGLRSTPNTWVREMRKNPAGAVHLITDTEGDTLKGGGYKEHGSVRPMIKKGFHGEKEQYTLKEEGTVSIDVWLSALITSTPRQLQEAMKGDTEDGFAARFIYHKTPPSPGIFDDVFGEEDNESIGKKLHMLGYDVQKIFEEHRRRDPGQPYRVTFSQQQKEEHRKAMQVVLNEALEVHPELNGFALRLSHSVLRTAALFSVLRANASHKCTGTQCDEYSWSAAAMLREHWKESMFDAFNLLNPKSAEEDGRMTVPEDVRELVCKWRVENGTMPSQAVMKLQLMTEPNIQHWLRQLDNPADAVGKIQRKHLKDLDAYRRTAS